MPLFWFHLVIFIGFYLTQKEAILFSTPRFFVFVPISLRQTAVLMHTIRL